MADPYPPEGVHRVTGAGQGTDVREASVGQLVSQVTTDLSQLVRQELELARAEIKQEVGKAGKSAGMLGGAGAAGYFALLFASLAVMWGLAEVIPTGWAALIVAVVYAIVGAVLYTRGQRHLQTVSPTPAQTVDTLKEDVQWAKTRTR
ncbi:MAG TPA: phage holin family protein [Frankiaceae bacterium]|nr:phage holin family protein [Frankiaceae bacterium]